MIEKQAKIILFRTFFLIYYKEKGSDIMRELSVRD